MLSRHRMRVRIYYKKRLLIILIYAPRVHEAPRQRRDERRCLRPRVPVQLRAQCGERPVPHRAGYPEQLPQAARAHHQSPRQRERLPPLPTLLLPTGGPRRIRRRLQ
eukprot:1184513-Prorocentrum_minimum.AAC.1